RTGRRGFAECRLWSHHPTRTLTSFGRPSRRPTPTAGIACRSFCSFDYPLAGGRVDIRCMQCFYHLCFQHAGTTHNVVLLCQLILFADLLICQCTGSVYWHYPCSSVGSGLT